MQKRWVLYWVLSLLIGKAWGLHLSPMKAHDVPCHGHAQAFVAQDIQSPDRPADSPEALVDLPQDEGHICCLVLVSMEEMHWPAGFLSAPDQPEPSWASTSRGPDLRPPIAGL